MKTIMRMFGTSAMAAVVAVGLATAPASAAPDRTELRKAMEELVSAGAAGIQIRVHDEKGDWTGSAGKVALGGREDVRTDGKFRAASITKTFMATVVLQLVGEGKIGLDDPVAKYLPQFALDKRITVRMVLQHASGLFNYTGDWNPDGTPIPGIPIDGQEFVDRWRFHTYQPEELVEVALSKPARFEPGTNWSYSNTNYIVAGLLIEKVTRTGYADQVRRRVLNPLGLRSTVFPGTWPVIPRPYAHGYHTYQHEGVWKTVDISLMNPSWAGAAFEIISTTADLDRFINALLAGKLLSPALLDEMRKMYPLGPDSSYGLGLDGTKASCGIEVLGHTGSIHGYHSFMFSTADGSKRFEASSTLGKVDDTNAGSYYGALSKVADAAVCGKAGHAADAFRVNRF